MKGLKKAEINTKERKQDEPFTEAIPFVQFLLTCAVQWSRRWGVSHFGVKFFGCFFGFLRPSYMHRGGGNCNLPSEKANKGPKSIPTLTQKVNFTL